ncbi:MAG: ROK family protein [Clostridia bacterium]|nr:ROK family protein [Clostridia bacterium]
MKYYIGVDIGGTNIAVGVVDEEFNIICKASIKTNAPRSAESICDDIASLGKQLCTDNGIDYADIQGYGVASPGIIKDGIVVLASNLKFEDVPLKEMLEERTGKSCSVCNDANAAALAEYVAGAGKGYHSLVAVTIGTGVGGGIVLNGRIWEGFNGAGAEIGHIVTVPGGRLCTCGNRGCLETYCSATALINDTKEAMINNPQSKLWEVCGNVDNVTGKSAYDAAEMGDEVAANVIKKFIKYLSIGVANIITLLQPEVVCIGGGMSAEGETLIAPLDKLVKESGVIRSLSKRPKIRTAGLFNDAGIVGAAADVMNIEK